ncbi:MAG: glycoside hydrolase family 38 N-terminal domain-containing protein [Candidatus Dormibacteria bacterium]
MPHLSETTDTPVDLAPLAQAVLWELGSANGDPRAFAHALTGVAAADDPVFRVGGPTHAWSGFHPGPLNGPTGFREVSQTVEFSLPCQPAGPHELVVRVFAGIGPCPDLRLDLNGRVGVVVLDPLRHDRTRLMGPPSPISGWAEAVVPVLGDWLRAGSNSLRLTTVLTHPAGDDSRTRARGSHPAFENYFGSSIQWGWLCLREAALASAPVLRVRPLPLFVCRGGELGELEELIELIVSVPYGFERGQVRGRVGCVEVELPLQPAGHQWGEIPLRVGIPDPKGDQQVDLVLDLDGRQTPLRTTITPCRRWTLHLIPHVHLDLGYTDHQGKVLELHSRNVERTLDLLDARPDYAFALDGSLILGEYLGSRSPGVHGRLIEHLRSGRLGVNVFYALFLTGVASLDECFRAAQGALEMGERMGFAVECANLTDVPSYSWAIPSILADLGIDGFMGIMNHTRASTAESDGVHLGSPFRWRGPDGGEVLAFFSDCYSQLRFMCGDPPLLEGCEDGFVRYTRRYERADYLPDHLPIVGIHGDNEDLGRGEEDLVARWNATYAYPRLRFSTMAEYFEAVRPLRHQLPLVAGDGGSFWEDGIGSDAALVASYRDAQSRLPDAEALGTLLSLVDPRLAPHREELGRGWEALLMGCEHTWSSAHSVSAPHSQSQRSQLRWKHSWVAEASRIAEQESWRVLGQLGELVTTEGLTALVANPLSWARDAVVEMEVAPHLTVAGAECEVLAQDGPLALLRAHVRDIPAFGYRTLPLIRSEQPPVAPVEDAELRTQRYIVDLDRARGRVTGLFSTALQRQILTPGSLGLGDVIYVTGGGDGDYPCAAEHRTTLHDNLWYLPHPDLTAAAATMTVGGVRRTPWGLVIELLGSAPSLPSVRTRLELYDGSDRVDVEVCLCKEEVLDKEAVYVVFPFAVGEDPVMRYDRQLGWVDPRIDHHAGACNEWFTTQYGVSVSDDISVTWISCDAPLFTWGDIVRGRWPARLAAGDGSLYSWVMNNHWMTNYRASQSGEVRLRYAFLPSTAWEPASATRFGREARHRAMASTVTLLDKADAAARPLPATAGQLWPAVVPRTVVAEVRWPADGQGILVRLLETAGQGISVQLPHPHGGGSAWLCDGAGFARGRPALPVTAEGTVLVHLQPWGVRTVRFLPAAVRMP